MDEKKTSLVEKITLTSVPADQRKSWPSIAFIWAGSVICIPALLVGSLISAGMNFKQSALCMVIGYVLVVFYMCLMGIQSSDLGLPATVAISRAYGKRGSSFLVSLVIAVCMIGWFAAQTSLCASSFCNIMSVYFHVNFPLWLSVIIWGCLMFITSVYGVKLIEFLNKVSVPALFVMLILLFTFKSAGLPVLLILVIQGSIWLNFSVPAIENTPLYFLGYLIVNSIQMGANIDYAIVISSHYTELKQQYPPKKAIVEALNASFPTIFTSGTILAAAGSLIAVMTTNPVIATIGDCLGRGTIISIVLVLAVLPQILVLGDTIIERTSFEMPGLDRKVRTASGTMHVHGRVRGYISGVIDAEVNGILTGQINASIATGDVEVVEDHPALEEGATKQ